MLPDHEEFPYVIRLVSECVTSNGSTSMASTCGSTLALMDAGVPIKAPGRRRGDGPRQRADGRFAVLTDILGKEDSFGDMDFKVTGTRDGITALQMDIKVQGINEAIIRDGLEKALAARLSILDKMTEVLPEAARRHERLRAAHHHHQDQPREDPRDHRQGWLDDPQDPGRDRAPRSTSRTTARSRSRPSSGENSRKAIQWIESLTREVEVGGLYLGKVTRIMGFGAFVEILPGKEGLVRIGELADYHVPTVEDVVSDRRRDHGRRRRDRPPGSRQPLAQGGHAAPPRPGDDAGLTSRSRSSTQPAAAGRPAAAVYHRLRAPTDDRLSEPCPTTNSQHSPSPSSAPPASSARR